MSVLSVTAFGMGAIALVVLGSAMVLGGGSRKGQWAFLSGFLARHVSKAISIRFNGVI